MASWRSQEDSGIAEVYKGGGKGLGVILSQPASEDRTRSAMSRLSVVLFVVMVVVVALSEVVTSAPAGEW